MPETQPSEQEKHIFTLQEWIEKDMSEAQGLPIIGTPTNQLVRPLTKNLIEAPEKSYKTTFLLRLMAGLSCGQTVFPQLPVPEAQSVLYIHGELSDPEIQERSVASVMDLPGPFDRLWQGREISAHLINPPGQEILIKAIEELKPQNVVLDPWQSFISGYEENSFKDMSAATTFCNKLIEFLKVTLWIPIHEGKNRKKGARGHSTIAGWRDTLIRLSKPGGESGVNVRVEPRWAEPPEPFRIRFYKNTVVPTGKASFSDQTEHIRAFVEAHGGRVHWEEVRADLDKKADTVRKAIDRAEEAFAIDWEGDFVVVHRGDQQFELLTETVQ